MLCHSCSEPVPDGARFCPSCGAPQLLEAQDEERRVVTVLFADLVGFTSLSEQRDPETVKRLIDRVFQQLVRDVESHGGVVDKVLGDAIVALFGAPVAHEDDADRAVRAALAMQRSLRDFRRSNPTDAVRMRIGINTGEVLVGTLAGSDYTAMGDVVNTAARLQEFARPGSVLVGDATRELCSTAIRFVRVDAVQLRGREQETTIWRALSVETAVIARRWQFDVPFVGRAAELGMMSATTSGVLAGRSAIVLISGEAGIGKSRLVEEAITPLIVGRPDTLLLEGACAPYGESNVWWPVAGGLLARLGFDRNDSAEASRRRITRQLRAGDDFEPGTPGFDRTVELVMHLLGHPSGLDALGPAGLRDAVVSGIVEALRGRVHNAPVILWVDDLQWAAPVLIDLLETVARQLAGLPVLIVTTSRPDEQRATDWPPPIEPALTMHLSLDALDESDADALVAETAGKSLPEGVVDTIRTRSGGNPLFLIELTRLAVSSDDPSGSTLPGSMRALISARLDQLSVSQRQILDNAAILGNEGRIEALHEFAVEVGQQFDDVDLVGIEVAGLMARQGARWRFRSDVVREVAYQTLTKQSRAQRHAGVARYLATSEPALVDWRAHHAATAAELRAELGRIRDVPDDIAVEATLLLAAAAHSWAEQGANRRAVGLIDRALAIGVTDVSVHRSLLLLRVESLVELHDMRPARSHAVELAAFAEQCDDLVLRGEAARLLGTIEQTDGDLVAARRYLSAAVAEFRELGDEPHLAEALRARGFAEVFGGSLAEADRFLAEAEELFGRADDRRGTAWVYQHRAWVSFLSGDHDMSERRLWHAIDAFTELDDRAGKAWSHGLLGYVYHFTRRDDEALAMAAEVLGDAKKWGDDWGSSMMRNLQASVWLWRGQPDEARVSAERSLSGFRRIDDRFGIIQSLSTLNRVYAALGRTADADRSVEETLALSGAFGELAYPLIAAAGTAMHLGNGQRAADLAAEAVARLDTTGANVDEGRVLVAFGRLLLGDADGTLAQLLDVDVERSPFALAARATAHAVLGDRERAIDDVRAVESMDAVSYWDSIVAQVAGAVAARGEEAERRRAALTSAVADLEDVVVISYASDVLQRLGHDVDHPGRSAPPGGWSHVAAALTAAT